MEHSVDMINFSKDNKFMEFLYKSKVSKSKGIIRNIFSYLKMMHYLKYVAIIDFNTLLEIYDFISSISLLFYYENDKEYSPIVFDPCLGKSNVASFTVINSIGKIEYNLYTDMGMVDLYFRRKNSLTTHISFKKYDDITDNKYDEYLLLEIINITMDAVESIISSYYWNI